MNKHTIEAKGLPSASSFDANFRCLGKWELCQKLPEGPDTAASTRGTKIHAALAASDLSELSASDQITASICMHAEAELIHEYNMEGSQAWWEDHPEQDLRIDRLWGYDDDFAEAWSAKLDSLHLHPDGKTIFVPDYKTGFGVPVGIERNWQVKAQAALAVFNVDSPGYGAERVISALIHPHHPDSLHQVKVFNAAELERHLVTITGLVATIRAGDQPRTPNGISCQFCAAKGVCPEYKQQQARKVEALQAVREDGGFAEIVNMTPEERGEDLRGLKSIEKDVAARREQYAKLLSKEPDSVKGWRLKTSWLRDIGDEAKAIEITRKTFGETAATHALNFSLTGLEKFLATSMKAKDAKEAVNNALKPVMKFKPKASYPEEIRS